MSSSIRIPISPSFSEPYTFSIKPVQFPQKCVYCGQDMNSVSDVNINRKINRSKNVGGKGERAYFVGYVNYFKTTLQVPYCQKHSTENTRNVALLGNASSVGILIGLACSIYAWTTQSIVSALLWTAGLVIGCAIMTYAFTKYIMFRTRKELRDTALSGGLGIATNVLLQSDELLNTNGRFESLEVKFVNPDIAREFAQLNGLEIYRLPKLTDSYKPRFLVFLVILAVVAALCALISIIFTQ